MPRKTWTWVGAVAGLGLALFLLLTPPDTDSLFLDGVQTIAGEGLPDLAEQLQATKTGEESPVVALREIRVSRVFMQEHVVEGERGDREQVLVRSLERGRDPERDLVLRVRSALRKLQRDSGEEGFPILLPDAERPADCLEGVLILSPGFEQDEDGVRSTKLALELRVDGLAAPLATEKMHRWPAKRSLIPPLIAIAVAVIWRRTIPALLLAVILGSALIAQMTPSNTVEVFVSSILIERIFGDVFRVEIILFVVFLCMAIGVMSRSGGIHGLVEWLSKYAKGPVSTQMIAYLSGLLIFFDDYSNCIIVGNTMRPLSDRRRVSREKLAWIVDSTAAPIAAIAIFSTWIAYEISMFAPQLGDANPLWTERQGFEIFLRTIPFRFYCILTLLFIPMTILFRRELGPMLSAERRARHLGQPIAPNSAPMVSKDFDRIEPKGDPKNHLARLALLPIAVLLGVTLGMIWWTGRGGDAPGAGLGARLRGILSEADSVHAIYIGALCCFLAAAFLAIAHRLLSLGEVLVAALRSARALFFAVIILILAWGIGLVCEDLETASYLVAITKDWIIPELLPAILFLTACMIAFSTGSSWSTMAILLPNVVVLAWILGEQSALGSEGLLVLSIGAVLEGSIFGDHCSPISDTTVLSSVSTASNHLDHVKTQAPYALLVMSVSLLLCYLPVAVLGFSPWPCLATGALVLAGILFILGRDPSDAPPESEVPAPQRPPEAPAGPQAPVAS